VDEDFERLQKSIIDEVFAEGDEDEEEDEEDDDYMVEKDIDNWF